MKYRIDEIAYLLIIKIYVPQFGQRAETGILGRQDAVPETPEKLSCTDKYLLN